MTTSIIERNFFRILRAGAFDDKEAMEPMSPFKWRRLFQMVEAQDVVAEFIRGANSHVNDEGLNLPEDLVQTVKDKIEQGETRPTPIGKAEAQLNSKLLAKRLERLVETERHSIDTSTETLELLYIMVYNLNQMLNSGKSLGGIIRLGQFLRKRGDKVDFVKLENWLSRLHLDRMAQFQGSILMAVFGFEQDELPFVLKEERDAYKLTLRSVSNLAKDTAEEWHFKQSSTGFVRNNSSVLRRNLRRSVRYYPYAPLETTSTFFHNLGRSLSEIEE